MNSHPYLHATNEDPPRVWHKLPKSYSHIIKKPHDERVDRESEATQESNLIKAHFPKGKCISFLVWAREANPSFIKKLKSISKLNKSILV